MVMLMAVEVTYSVYSAIGSVVSATDLSFLFSLFPSIFVRIQKTTSTERDKDVSGSDSSTLDRERNFGRDFTVFVFGT